MLQKSRRLTASEELNVIEQKKKVIAEQAAADATKRAITAELAEETK